MLFDVGSTLLDFRPQPRNDAWAEILGAPPDVVVAAWQEARTSVAQLTGFETRQEYDAFRTEVCSLTFDGVSAQGDRDAAAAAMASAWIRCGWEPYPEIPAVLTRLRADGYRLGVVSNWTATLALTLEHVGLAEHFEVVACSAEVGANKPDPRIFRYALDALAIDPEDALHVGDHHEADILGARSAGVRGVLISRDGAITAPDTPTIRSLEELSPFLTAP